MGREGGCRGCEGLDAVRSEGGRGWGAVRGTSTHACMSVCTFIRPLSDVRVGPF